MATDKDMYAVYGAAVHAAGRFEFSVASLTLIAQMPSKGTPRLPDQAAVEKKINWISKRTLEALRKELDHLGVLEPAVRDWLIATTNARNDLVHHFLNRHATLLATEEGRDLVTEELLTINERMQSAANRAHHIVAKLSEALNLSA